MKNLKSRRIISLVVCVGLILTGSAFAVESDYINTCETCIVIVRSQYYIDNFTDAEKREIEASVCEARTQQRLDYPEIFEDRAGNAEFVEDFEAMLAEVMNDIRLSEAQDSGNEISIICDFDGIDINDLDLSLMSNNIHEKGGRLFSTFDCINHYIYPNSSGQYMCVYIRTDYFVCRTHEHLYCMISEYAGTFTGVVH